MGIMRFLNSDEIARGLSPLDPTLSAFRAGRILIEEARALLSAKASFAIESTLSGKTYIAMLRHAREQGYRIVLHYILIESASQAVDRVALRVIHGGHHVPEDDVCRRFDRSRKHVIEDHLPLADDWGVWDNHLPPAIKIAGSGRHSLSELNELLISSKLMETAATKPDTITEMVLEASEAATAKMLDYYKRMGIRVTPQMTLAPEPKKRARKAN
jgi:predicted ABC-type ATPase